MTTDHEGELRAERPAFTELLCQWCAKPFPTHRTRQLHESKCEDRPANLYEVIMRFAKEKQAEGKK